MSHYPQCPAWHNMRSTSLLLSITSNIRRISATRPWWSHSPRPPWAVPTQTSLGRKAGPAQIKEPFFVLLRGIETVNASGFDDLLLCEPSQSSASARLASLHHLMRLCGRRGIMKLFCCSSTRRSLSPCRIPVAVRCLWKQRCFTRLHHLQLKQADTVSVVNLQTRHSRCAARQRSHTAEHDQHEEKVRAAATRLVRLITAFSADGGCVCLRYGACARTHARTHARARRHARTRARTHTHFLS